MAAQKPGHRVHETKPPMDRQGDHFARHGTGPRSGRKLKRDPKEVSRKRQALGIPSAKPMRPWTPNEIKWLGRKSDADVARRLGRKSATVAFQRRKLGLAAFGSSKSPWLASEEKLLGTVSDSRLAKRLNRSLNAGRNCESRCLGRNDFGPGAHGIA